MEFVGGLAALLGIVGLAVGAGVWFVTWAVRHEEQPLTASGILAILIAGSLVVMIGWSAWMAAALDVRAGSRQPFVPAPPSSEHFAATVGFFGSSVPRAVRANRTLTWRNPVFGGSWWLVLDAQTGEVIECRKWRLSDDTPSYPLAMALIALVLGVRGGFQWQRLREERLRRRALASDPWHQGRNRGPKTTSGGGA